MWKYSHYVNFTEFMVTEATVKIYSVKIYQLAKFGVVNHDLTLIWVCANFAIKVMTTIFLQSPSLYVNLDAAASMISYL